MSQLRNKVPLGTVLQQAGLVSAEKIKHALLEQKQGKQNVKIGRILASKGDVKPQTADFFAEYWLEAIKEEDKQPLGYYLKQAALLSEQQIQAILTEQQQNQDQLKFGEIAIAKGWLKQKTVNFFLRYLAPEHLSTTNVVEEILENKSHAVPVSPIVKTPQKTPASFTQYSPQGHQSFLDIKLKLLNINNQDDFSERVLNRILWWSGGQSFLTRKIFELASKSKGGRATIQKSEEIDFLVRQELLESWQLPDVAKHFQDIRERIIYNKECEPVKLLRIYRQTFEEKIAFADSKEQKQLLKTGLVVRQQDKLATANPVYRTVFDRNWVSQELNLLNSFKDSNLSIVPTDASSSAMVSTPQKPEQSAKFRNSLLIIALIALLSLLFANITRRIAVRSSFNQGNELLRQKSYEQAVAEYDDLLSTDSNYFQAWTNRGYALAGLEKHEQMRESCSTATIIEPNAVYAWNCLGEALHNLGQEEKAIVAFDRAIALNSNDPIFLINKSEALKTLGQTEESLTVIQTAIQVLERIEAAEGKEKVKGEFAVALTFLGNGYRQDKEYAMAVDSYNRALLYSPDYFPAQIGKGIVLNKVERYREAQQEYQKILENEQLNPAKQAQAWFYLGKSFCQSRQENAGIAALEKAIELLPKYEAAKQAQTQCSQTAI